VISPRSGFAANCAPCYVPREQHADARVAVQDLAVYRIDSEIKRDPRRRWALPDRVFFACGACHILAHCFLEAYPRSAGEARWFKPEAGFTGNHIIVAGDGWVFDYHGYAVTGPYLVHLQRKAERWWPGWRATIHTLPPDVLISEAKSRTHEGLWLREPGQFLEDPRPRARRFLSRFPPPPGTVRGA
jgi:hypothetical protein